MAAFTFAIAASAASAGKRGAEKSRFDGAAPVMLSEPNSPRRGVRFNAEINLGHILTAAVMLASLVTIFLSVNSRITVLEVRLPALEKSAELMLQSQKQAVEQSFQQTRALDRLTLLVEEMRAKQQTR